MEQITCRPKRRLEEDALDENGNSISGPVKKRTTTATSVVANGERQYPVVRQAADNANGSGGLSDLIVLPPTVSGGGCFTVFRRTRPTFSGSMSLLSTCDVDAPLRCELSTDTLTHSVHTTPVRQFRLVPDRPNFNYAVSSVDGTDHPRVYFCIRNNSVVDCAVAGSLNPGQEAGWLCEMINEVCSCRLVPDRDFVVTLRRRDRTDVQPEELSRVSASSLSKLYSGKLSPSPCELREFHLASSASVDGKAAAEPLYIPSKNMWNGMYTGRMGPCEERFSHPLKQRRPLISAPLLEVMPGKDIDIIQSLKIFNNEVPANPETGLAVYIPLTSEMGYDMVTRFLCDGTIVLTDTPEVYNYVVHQAISSGLPVLTYLKNGVQDLEPAMKSLLGDNLDPQAAAVYLEAAKRFSYQWLDVSCTLDNLADTIASTPAPPLPSNGWSPNWVVEDDTRKYVLAVERRAGSLGIGTYSTCFPIPFIRFSDKEIFLPQGAESHSTSGSGSSSSLSSRGARLASLISVESRNVDTFFDRSLTKLTRRADDRPGASQYEALSGLVASGELRIPNTAKDSTLFGMGLKAAVYPLRELGTRASYAGISCVNDMCRECDAFLYTIGGGSLSHLEVAGPYVVYTEPLPMGCTSLYEFVKDQSVGTDEKEAVLAQLRLVLEWAYERFEFLHNKLDPTKTIFVGPRLQTGVRTSLRFSNRAVGSVKARRQVYIVDYSRSTYKYCLSPDSETKITVTGGRDAFLDILPRLPDVGTKKITAIQTRYTKEGTEADSTYAKNDRLPAELYLCGFWGSNLVGGIRRYINRLHHGRVPWMSCDTDDSYRLGKARLHEIASIQKLLNEHEELRRDPDRENMEYVLKKIARVYDTCVKARR